MRKPKDQEVVTFPKKPQELEHIFSNANDHVSSTMTYPVAGNLHDFIETSKATAYITFRVILNQNSVHS